MDCEQKDRQTKIQRNRVTDTLITILRIPLEGDEVIRPKHASRWHEHHHRLHSQPATVLRTAASHGVEFRKVIGFVLCIEYTICQVIIYSVYITQACVTVLYQFYQIVSSLTWWFLAVISAFLPRDATRCHSSCSLPRHKLLLVSYQKIWMHQTAFSYGITVL